uniref:RNA helicase n=1 Tax=Tetraodon nigroviridis TaxID=99883 RepID=H3BY61_TETNG
LPWLQVDSPSCIWSRVSSGPGGQAEAVEQYRRLTLQMNRFYHDVSKEQLKPAVLEQGQVCVVYWSVIRSWCRARVESLFVDSVYCMASCLLVDHGHRLVVSSEQIRVASQEFLQMPFWVKKCHLAGIQPTTLKVNLLEGKAKLTPSTQWDSSATLYLHSLLRVSTQSEVVLLQGEAGSAPIMLYVTMENIKICVNDDLVAKKFAVYASQLAAGSMLITVSVFSWNFSAASEAPAPAGFGLQSFWSPGSSVQPAPGVSPGVWEEEEESLQEEQHQELPEEAPKSLLNRDPDGPEDRRVISGDSSGPAQQDQMSTGETASLCWGDAAGSVAVSACPLLIVSLLLSQGCWRTSYSALSPADCSSWPSVSRGVNTLVISQRAQQPLSYLPPLLTNILLSSDFSCQASSSGPLAVLLCPGWQKAQVVSELLEELKVNHSLHPTLVLLGLGEDQAQDFRVPQKDLVLVTTPFTLVRLLSCHCFLFLRLSHLVLDEADQLF